MFAMFPRNPGLQRRALVVGLGRSYRGALRWIGPGLLVLTQGLGLGQAQAQFSTRIVGSGPRSELPEERAVSTVTQSEIEQRLVRSAPDALRYEAGVFIQQSAHGQASAFLRGLTGQQTLLLFDGIRLNNSTYRQGPNQYFFTLDSQSIASISVLRGGGSTRGGSDALGGIISAYAIEPLLPERGLRASAQGQARFTTADSEKGGRLQVSVGYGSAKGWALGFVGGVGGREVGQLESGGPVLNPTPDLPIGPLPYVPRYAPDMRTQLGTGFKELTADGRLVLRLSPRSKLTLAGYLYRQYDAPRTDQCPPPTAPPDTCLTYEQQFRHMTYLAWDGQLGAAAKEVRVALSFQSQHERRRFDDPSVVARVMGIDDVSTLGFTASAATRVFRPHERLSLRLHYGADSYLDWVQSTEDITYTDVKITSAFRRGQYLSGSRYLAGGVFADGEVGIGTRVLLRSGARLSWADAYAPADPESGSQAVAQTWKPVTGHVGLEVRAAEFLRLLLNVDNSYRAPNLNDLTARQQTGPGFQFENALLLPERAWTFEAGARLRSQFLRAELWLFETLLQDAVLKVAKPTEDCPLGSNACRGAWSRFKLENAPSLSEMRGVELMLKANLPLYFSARATLAYAWGEGPRVGNVTQEATGVMLQERVPLSRIPPLNGTGELAWDHPIGLRAGLAVRWATLQDRLAIADYSDGRIPKYGTPGFAVLDLRLGYSFREHISLSAVIENLLDAPYRYHGSSINGPARGLSLVLKVM